MRGMNGSTGSPQENRAFTGGIPPPVPPLSGLGVGPGGLGPGGPPSHALGLHSQVAAAAAAGMGGPELKHHADFLSRLLAATPSYMSEMGNPPPGFFSDWLRRLVSKPSGNNSGQSSGLTFPGGGAGQPEGGEQSRAPSTTPSLDAQLSSKRRKRSRLNDHSEHHPLGGSSTSGNNQESERIQPNAGHPPHLPTSSSGGIPCSVGGPMTSSASSPPIGGGAPPPPFPGLGAYPFWFFPPFLPPYGMGMNMGFPGHPSSGPAAQAAALSSYLGGASQDLFRSDNLNLLACAGRGGVPPVGGPPPPFPPPPPSLDHLSHSHMAKLSAAGRLLSDSGKGEKSPPVPRSPSTSSAPQTSMKDSPSFLAAAAAAASASFLLGGTTTAHSGKLNNQQQLPSPSSAGSHYSNNHNGLLHKMTAKSPPGSNPTGTKQSNNNKSQSSFSISRLTSPSPSSNSSSGGSCSGSNLGNSKYPGGHPNRTGHRSSSSSSFYEDTKPQLNPSSSYKAEESSVLKSNLNSGPKMAKDDPGLCVDLRVSGRIWENSGAVPPPRSIYTPLSAFRDPSDVNLFNPSQLPRYDPHHHPLPPPHALPLSLLHNKVPPPLGSYPPHPHIPSGNNSSNISRRSPSTPSGGSSGGKNLSTKYVLRNIQHIYQRIGPTPHSTREKGSPTLNPNQITTSHPINNHHSPPSSKSRSPPSGQNTINHHHPGLHSDNKNNALHNKSKKTNGDQISRDEIQPPLILPPPDSENEDNNVIISNSRPHSSSSSILEDDDFKPEAKLKMAIKDNTLNLTLNNNNVEKRTDDEGEVEGSGGDRKDHKNREEKKRRKSTELVLGESRLPQTKHRKLSFSSGDNNKQQDEERRMKCADNPYNFVDGEEKQTTPKNKGNSKNSKAKRENNNEVEDDESSKKIKISLAKVKSEVGEEEDDGEEGGVEPQQDHSNEQERMVNNNVPSEPEQPDMEEQEGLLEC